MKHKFLLFAVLMTVLTGALFGVGDMAFQMSAVTTVAYAIKPFLPTFNLGIAGLRMADTDVVEQIQAIAKDFKTHRESLEKQQTALKEGYDKVMDTITKGTKLDKESQDNIDKAISKANETSLEVVEIGKKLDELRKSFKAPQIITSIRGAIAKELASEEMKVKYDAFNSGDGKALRIMLKEITSADVGTGMKREPYIDSLVSMERRPLRIRDLLTVVPVQSDSIKYGRQTLRTNAARIVAEGSPKPYSTYKWEDATAPIETIAHLAKLTLQAIADAPRLAAEVESEMRYGLAFAEEDEILNGDGTAGHLSGLIDNATAYAVPAGMATANILTGTDRLRVAQLQIHLAFATPDGQVLNPISLAELELERRDPDKGGGYLFGNPDGNTGVTRLWRLPVVESASMPVGEFLVGAFKYSVHLYDRMGVVVLISTENDDDFERNKATMRCESRVGLGVRRTYGLVHGDLNGGS
jgi:HK97 family phage major capsid protein